MEIILSVVTSKVVLRIIYLELKSPKQKKKSYQLYDLHIVSNSSLCWLVTDFRTFYNDYLMVVTFYEWLKEKAEG